MARLEVGKFYKTRDGRKVGPVFMDGDNDPFVWFDQNGGCWAIDGEDGNAVGNIGSKTSGDIIAEWTEEPAGPVRTVTRKEIVPGTYGRVRITNGGYVHVNSMKDAAELRAAIATLTEIADAMENK